MATPEILGARKVAPDTVSLSSFVLMAVLYAPFAVSLREGTVDAALWRWTMKLYCLLYTYDAADE